MIFLYILPVLILLSSPAKADEPVITVEAVETGCQCSQEIADTTENLHKKIEELENQNKNFQDHLNILGDRLVKLQILTHSREVCFEDVTSSKCEGSQSGQVGIVEAIRVDGGWGPWQEWSQCTATCGGGSQARNRTCSDPEPQLGGKNCIGPGEDGRKCNEEECCPDGMIRLNGVCSECLLENNYDYRGNDISGRASYTNNVDECAAECGQNSECSYWTYVKYSGDCWMKYSKSGKRYKDEVISGNKGCSGGPLPDYDDYYRSTNY